MSCTVNIISSSYFLYVTLLLSLSGRTIHPLLCSPTFPFPPQHVNDIREKMGQIREKVQQKAGRNREDETSGFTLEWGMIQRPCADAVSVKFVHIMTQTLFIFIFHWFRFRQSHCVRSLSNAFVYDKTRRRRSGTKRVNMLLFLHWFRPRWPTILELKYCIFIFDSLFSRRELKRKGKH